MRSRWSRILWIAGLVLAAFAALPQKAWCVPEWAAKYRLPAPRVEKLSNGLELAWFLDDSLPLVDFAVLVRSGSRDDRPGKSGTAELVSNLLDKGAGSRDAKALALAVEQLGASSYINADDDTFSVGLHGLAEDADLLLGILSDLVQKPRFPDDEFRKERSSLLDRWKHIGDYAQTLASLAFQRALLSGTTYGRGSIWNEREAAAVALGDLREFHSSHFTPGNSVLMIVGKVDEAAVRARIQKLFGGWAGPPPARERKSYSNAAIMPEKGQKLLLVHRPGLSQAQVRIGWEAPSIKSPDRYALAVANTLLGEYFHSRLNTEIRDKLGLTYGIGSEIAHGLDRASWIVSSSTRNEMVGPMLKRTAEILRDVGQGNITDAEVETAKAYLVGGFPLGTATTSSVASRWLSGYIFDLGTDYLNEFIPRVSEVTPEQVRVAVKKHLRAGKAVIVVAGDAAKTMPSLERAGLTPVKRLDSGDLR
ncbi:MAG: insulinase family protein [Bdellovibrionales bacterium]|nr:insulinase family protein [Bdellovibrionales bacterium]